jgi:predicted nucleotidyltransferase
LHIKTDRKILSRQAEQEQLSRGIPNPVEVHAPEKVKPISPTLHSDVNEILNLLFTDITRILQDQFVGMYLFGSLANGDFDNDSDIDILIVIKGNIEEKMFSALAGMHEKISTIDSPWATQLEVSYIPQTALRRYDPLDNKHPHHDRGKDENLHIMRHDSDWVIQRYILRERGITIMGPDPKSLIDPVSSADLKWAVMDILNSWIKGFLDDSRILENRGYQSYTVLTLCRILHMFEHGTVVSKPTAAEWAKRTLNKKWTPLIERAWVGRHHPGLKSEPEDLNGTLDFIRYTLEKTDENHPKK